MPERILIENCSPTLAGMKPGSLVSIVYGSKESARDDICEMNRIFVRKGLRAVPLAFRNEHLLLYLYRPEFLAAVFANADVRRFLEKRGYDCSNVDRCVVQLGEHVRAVQKPKEFPHEIGVFLGYPLEDVEGFINHKEDGCKCVGFWRVYGDEQKARKTFDGYRSCTSCYLRSYEKGWHLDRLAVKKAAVQGM